MLLLYRNKYRHKQSPRNIYIPLCFYFIFLPSTQKGLQHPFTFHYASTLSDQTAILNVKKQNLHSTMLLLYLFRSSSSSSVDNDLHSTMLLLYPVICYVVAFESAHLHSTMLLLYLFPPLILISQYSRFTFHYASTLSLSACAHNKIHHTFTFHYASTLSRLWRRIGEIWIYLHSTMLLLYRLPE